MVPISVIPGEADVQVSARLLTVVISLFQQPLNCLNLAISFIA
jgi:hypothetical protein